MNDFTLDIDEAWVRRERAKARDLRQSQWWKRRLAKGVCHWCGRPARPADLTMDHIVPVSRGGRSTKGNLVPCCKACNNLKKQLLPMEWADYLERIRTAAQGAVPRSAAETGACATDNGSPADPGPDGPRPDPADGGGG